MIASATAEVNRRLFEILNPHHAIVLVKEHALTWCSYSAVGSSGGRSGADIIRDYVSMARTMRLYALQQQRRGLETPDLISFSLNSETISAVLRVRGR